MKAKGGSARSGDVIPYIFCLAEGEETAKTAQADRAKHPDEVRRADAGFQIGRAMFVAARFHLTDIALDFEYYLANQVLPPIERLCEPIEGTDRPRLAECLGRTLFSLFVALTKTYSQDWTQRGIATRVAAWRQGRLPCLIPRCRTTNGSRTQVHSLSAVATVKANYLSPR